MFTKKTPPASIAADSDIPTVADLAPRIAGELDPKLLSLGTERATLLDEMRELSLSTVHDEAAADHARERRIAEMTGLARPQPKPTRKDRLSEAAQRVADIDAALEVLRREIQTERNRAGTIIRERVAPLHRRLISDLCQAIVGVHKANAAYWGLLDCLESDGVSTGTLGDQRPWFVGAPRDVNSPLAIFLKELVRDGFIPLKDVPEELK